MKKPLFMFGVIFALTAWFFISTSVDELHRYAAIAKAPAYAPATPEGINERKFKRMTNYTVTYSYQVDGATHRIESSGLSKEGAEALASTPNMEVAYLAGAPDKAVMRIDFDKRDQSGSMSRAVVTALVGALILSLAVSLALSWKAGWLRRKTA